MLSETTGLGAPSTLREQAARLVKRELLSGAVEAGSILSANALSKELGISNSPMREALMDLAAQGLLEVVKNRGFRVYSMTRSDLRDVREMRSILEVAAIERLALRGMSEPERARAHDLSETSLAALRSGEVVDFLDADHAMHMYLVDLVGNPRLSAAIGSLRDQTRICGAFAATPPDAFEACVLEHRDLLDAIAAKDVSTAGRIMAEHLAQLPIDEDRPPQSA